MKNLTRQEKIIHMLLDKTTLSVRALEEYLTVSSWTIRRDLDELVSSGWVVREYGKVTLVDRDAVSSFVAPESIEHNDTSFAKVLVGVATARLIQHGQNIVMAAGTTTYEVARALLKRDVHCHVVTNGLAIALELSRSRKINVTCTGGEVNGAYQTMTGSLVERAIQKHYFDMAIIGVGGITVEQGLTVNSAVNATALSMMLEHSKHSVVATDHSKFGRTKFAHIRSLEIVDTIVTDIPPDAVLKTYLSIEGIRLVVAGRTHGRND